MLAQQAPLDERTIEPFVASDTAEGAKKRRRGERHIDIRTATVEGDVAYVSLTKGYVAVIDAADLHLVKDWNWSASVELRSDGSVRCVYAVRGERRPGGKLHTVRMHRVIAGTPAGHDTDHKDGDGLNNRRSNLRTATKSQNSQNCRVRADNTSGFKGVSWNKESRAWQAVIRVQGRARSLGRFSSKREAAEAYANASLLVHGDFGRTA